MIRVLILCLLVASPALAGEPTPIACAGPFARDSSHDRLVAAFGAENGPESSEHEATILFGADPERRLEVTWRETARAAGCHFILGQGLGCASGTPHRHEPRRHDPGQRPAVPDCGLRRDNAGLTAFPRGRLAALPGGCRITVRFAPNVPEPLGRRFAPIMGSREVRSAHPLMRAARPSVDEIFLSYPDERMFRRSGHRFPAR